MNRIRVMNEIVSLVAMAVVFLVIYAIDNWLVALRMMTQSTFDPAPYVYAASGTRVIAAALSLFLFWYAVIWKPAGLMTAVVYTCAGLIYLFWLEIAFSASFNLSLPSPLARLGFGALTLNASAVIAVTGLAIFVRLGWERWQSRAEKETAVTSPTPE